MTKLGNMTTQTRFKWTLKTTLATHNITRYALQKKAGVAMNTVRAMYDGTPERVDLPIIDKVVNALTQLTGQPMTPDDVLTWEPPTDEEIQLLEAGMADLKAQIEEIEKDVSAEEIAAWMAALEGKSA